MTTAILSSSLQYNCRVNNISVVAAMYQHPATRPKYIGGTSMAAIISRVYEIRNLVNGNRYIGSSVNIKGRWKHHKTTLRGNRHINEHLQRAWNRYGEDFFVFSVLEYCHTSHLIEREQYYLDEFAPEYNINPKAGSALGFRHSEASRAKMFVAQKYKRRAVMRFTLDGELIDKHESIQAAYRLTGCLPAHIVDCCQGKAYSADGFIWRYADSDIPPTYNPKTFRRVAQFSKDMVFIREYQSLKEAQANTGVSYDNISHCASGRYKTAGGFVWRFVEDKENKP